MQLNQIVAKRIRMLCVEQSINQYGLFLRSGVPMTTISSVLHCVHRSVTLQVLYGISEGFGISLIDFFNSPLFERENIDY